MVRTVISLEEGVKAWLDEKAADEGVPMTELIRRAVKLLKDQMDVKEPPTEDLLKITQGLWKRGNGLEYQKSLRHEW